MGAGDATPQPGAEYLYDSGIAPARTPRLTPVYKWTNPSVRALGDDPVAEITAKARTLVLGAIDDGWVGPPFDPFDLAARLGLGVVARDELDDARLVVGERDSPVVEFNPNRPRGRVRFSVAHEIGHSLFPDFADDTRYRSHSGGARADDWQLELLCNLAAAEILMPVGTLQDLQVLDLDINHLMDVRREYQVSTEALLIRIARLSNEPIAAFAAARNSEESSTDYRLDYLVASSAWPGKVPSGTQVLSDVLARCTAVGHTSIGDETWARSDLHVEAVGIPAYPGHRYPRVAGLVRQTEVSAQPPAVTYVRGDATQPVGEGLRWIAHVVNDKAKRWGGRGFAQSLSRKFPGAAQDFHEWMSSERHALGEVHVSAVDPALAIASLVAQAGYGESAKPRLRYGPLQAALSQLVRMAAAAGASLHMPLIGAGQAGGSWETIRQLLHETVADSGVAVTVYVMKDAAMPTGALPEQLTLV